MNSFLFSLFYTYSNTLLVFLAVAFFVETFLFLFRVKNPRIRALFRTLPIIKLPIDLIFSKIFHLTYFLNFNPFNCEKYLYDFITTLTSHTLISSPFWSSLVLVSLGGISLCIFVRNIIRFFKAQSVLKNIVNNSSPCTQPITTPLLQNALKRLKASIWISDETTTPFATHKGKIIFPASLLTLLSHEEFEAIVAHELEHIRWQDPLVKLSTFFLSSLFWWIPLKFWIKRLEFDQEVASDHSIHRYGLNSLTFASALYKGAKNAKPSTLFVSHIATNKNYLKRLEAVLAAPLRTRFSYLGGIAAFFLTIFISITWWAC